MLKGHHRFWLRLGFRIVNHNGGWLRDQGLTQAVEDIVARVLVEVYKSPEADDRLSVHQEEEVFARELKCLRQQRAKELLRGFGRLQAFLA